MTVPNTRPASFEVHLDELRRFGQQLAAQADALAGRQGELARMMPLADREGLLGGFAEADSLAAVHALALQRLRDLQERVAATTRFADAVVHDVAEHYERSDADAGDAFHTMASDPSQIADAAGPASGAWSRT